MEEGSEVSSHSQKVEQGRTRGEYRIFLPDNRWQIVSYVADDKGYRATVRYENAQESESRPEQTHWGFSTGNQNSAVPLSGSEERIIPPTYRPEPPRNPPQYSREPEGPPQEPQFAESYRPQLAQEEEQSPPSYQGVLRSQVNTFIIHPTPDGRQPAQGSEEGRTNFENYRRPEPPQGPPRPYYPPQRPVEVPPRPQIYTPRPYPPQQPVRPPPPPPPPPPQSGPYYEERPTEPPTPVYIPKEKQSKPYVEQDSIIYNPNVFHPFFEPVTERPKLVSIQPIRPFHILSNYDSRPIQQNLERPVRPNPPQSEPRPQDQRPPQNKEPRPQNRPPVQDRPVRPNFPRPSEPNQRRPPYPPLQRPPYEPVPQERPTQPYPPLQRPPYEPVPPERPTQPYPPQQRPTTERPEKPVAQKPTNEPTPSYEDRPTAIYIPQQRPTYPVYSEKPAPPPYVPQETTTTTTEPTPSITDKPPAVFVAQQKPEPPPSYTERPQEQYRPLYRPRPPYQNRYPPRPLQGIRPVPPEYLRPTDIYSPVLKRPHTGYDEPHTGYPPGVPLSGITSIRPILNPKEQPVITISPELESLEGVAPTEPEEIEIVSLTTTTSKSISQYHSNQFRKPLFRPRNPYVRVPVTEAAVELPIEPPTERPAQAEPSDPDEDSLSLLTRFKFKPSIKQSTSQQTSDGYGQRTQPRRKQTSQSGAEFFGTWPLEEDGPSESIRSGFTLRDEFDSRPLVTPFPEEEPLSDVEGFPPIEEEQFLNNPPANTTVDDSDIIVFDDGGDIPPLLLRIHDKGPPTIVEDITWPPVTTEVETEIPTTVTVPTTTTTTTTTVATTTTEPVLTTTTTEPAPSTKAGRKKKKRVRTKGLKRGNGTARTIMPASRKVQPSIIVKTEKVPTKLTNSTAARSSKIRFPPRIRFVQNQKGSERVTRQNENDSYLDDFDVDLMGADSVNRVMSHRKGQRAVDMVDVDHPMTKEDLLDLSLNSIPIDQLDLVYDSTELEDTPVE